MEDETVNKLLEEKIIDSQMPDNTPEFVYNDSQLGQMILKVRSKLTYKDIIMKVENPDGTVEMRRVRIPTTYRETLTEDLSSAFHSPLEKEAGKTIHLALASIKSFGDNYGIDMSSGYNLIADYFNSCVVESKGEDGKAARVAKSSYGFHEKTLKTPQSQKRNMFDNAKDVF